MKLRSSPPTEMLESGAPGCVLLQPEEAVAVGAGVDGVVGEGVAGVGDG
jgi:hypothetical protein